MRLAEAPGGGATEDPPVAGLEIGTGLQRRGQVRRNPAGRKRVDLDVVLGPLDGQHAGELLEGGLRGGVGRHRRHPQKGGHGADVEDLAPTGPDHVPSHLLRQEEGPLQVGVKDGIPFCRGIVQRRAADVHPGIVDQDVDPAEPRHDRFHGAGDGVQVGHIQRHREGLPPGAAFAAGRARVADGREHGDREGRAFQSRAVP